MRRIEVIGAMVARALLCATVAWCCLRCTAKRSCPAPFVASSSRQEAMFSLLAESERGAHVLREARGRANIAVCFAEAPSAIAAVTPDGMVLLDARLGDAEAAARLGHLLHHVSRGLTGTAPRADGCEAAAREALAEEARALAFEVELRRALHVREGVLGYEFEEAFFREAPGARVALVERYLLDHPDGAPGLDALAVGYARRCRERRR